MKKWIIKQAADPARSLLAGILQSRGIVDVEGFLNPKLASLRDPQEIPGIMAAAGRVLLARERGEKVLVYGDYDVDGVTATAIMLQTLRRLGLQPDYYIPHRYGEGYGLSLPAVKKIAAAGVKLIVTVDCGISSIGEIAAAGDLGMDVVITDHHNLPPALPAASAIVNPKQIAGEHPAKYLSGAGVAFKFAWALLRLAGEKDSVFLTSLLDLAALGTFSDVVPLTGENRILAAGGLKLINERRRLGIRLLAEAASLSGGISVGKVYFGLAPRLNAAGRLEHASKAVELLLTNDPIRGKEMAQELNRINAKRQDIGSLIQEEVFSSLTDEYIAANKMVILSGQNWHPGVIGIVASRVVELYHRPTVLIGVNEGMGRGSARSFDGLNLFELLSHCRDLFLDFGGHEGAAGFEIEPDNIPRLKERLKSYVDDRLSPEDLIPRLEVDAELEPAQITLILIKELERLEPFGEGNPEPVFMIRGLALADFKKVGRDGKHFKAWFTRDGIKLETIGFGLGKFADKLTPQRPYDIAFNLESNEYNGFESAQLSLIDLREAEK